jgi:hypothetical protein
MMSDFIGKVYRNKRGQLVGVMKDDINSNYYSLWVQIDPDNFDQCSTAIASLEEAHCMLDKMAKQYKWEVVDLKETKTDPDAPASEMTIRAKIATAVLAGVYSDPEAQGSAEQLAKCAVKAADALIAELNK